MKITNRAKINGVTKTQLEDWTEDLTSNHARHKVATYPVARESVGGQFGPRRGKTFRLALDFDTEQEAKAAQFALITGATKLLDYVNYFENPSYAGAL